jgi:cyclopropane fatty-acyl-phospholipid synthase-like methyltransferase
VESWLLDELALAGPEHVDPAVVGAYDRKAGFDPAPDIALLRELGLDEDSTLLDFGAGSGTFALAAAPVAERVVAIDVSPAMVATLRAKVEVESVGNVECVQAGFLTYEHVGEPADVVYSRNALHHLPDFWKGIALSRVASILRSGGVLRLRDLVYSFDPADAERFLGSWIASGAASSSVGWTSDELRAHVRDEHSTFAWILEDLLQHVGFQLEDVRYDASKIFGDYVAVRQ